MADPRAEAAVDEIVADLRQRKILKWLFDEDPDNAGELWPGVRAIDATTQDDMFDGWARIIEKHIKSSETTT